MQCIRFESVGFRDGEEIVKHQIDGIEGQSLAQAIAAHLVAKGCQCEEVIDDEEGWVFYALCEKKRYLITAGMTPVAVAAIPKRGIRAPDGTLMQGKIDIDKHRSLLAELLGYNRLRSDDAVVQGIKSFLENHPDCKEIKRISA